MTAFNKDDTIAAVATPPGRGAIGVIRVSGKETFEKLNDLFKGADLHKVGSHTANFGTIRDNGEILDEVVVTVFKSPRSYTGEDVAEISCHGSDFVLRRILEALIQRGVRHAGPGEFTMRAFLNGKMDLSQAEGVADLIASESSTSKEAALHQMRGGFSKKIRDLRERLLNFSSMLELELDFSQEDVEFANRKELHELLTEIKSTVKKLVDSFQMGNVIKNGISVVLAGRPNAGKSTLLNALVEEERAIVSDIPGTTRDVIEDMINIKGFTFRFLDTAGIRKSKEAIEQIGVERTLKHVREAHLVVYIFDISETPVEEVKEDISQIPAGKPYVLVGNKIDKGINYPNGPEIESFGEIIRISSLRRKNLEELKDKLVEIMELDRAVPDSGMVTNLRHYQALQETYRSIREVENGFKDNLTTDLVAIDIQKALQAMGEITGEISNDEILGNIFEKFCIGK